ncbi:MAG: TldD/PmbA family protein [Dehalococcoidia bacterium]
MEELLQQAKKTAQEAEVFSVSSRTTDALFETNRLKQVQTRESTGTALRLIKEGRIGFAATTRSDGKKELIDMALEMAPFGAEARFEFPGARTYPSVQVFDEEVEKVSPEAMVELGQSMIDKLKAAAPDVVCEGSVSRRTSYVEIINSGGGKSDYRKSVFSIMLEGVLIRGTDMLFVGDVDASCHRLTTSENLAQTILEQLERARETAPSVSGMVPVIFTPHGVASALISPLVVAFNGKTVLRGASPLGQRLGDMVFSPDFSLYDDSTIDFCPASSICDDEGVPARCTSLIEKGVVGNFIYDLQTAGEAGEQSTGNASRSVASLPGPSMNALIIEEGKVSFADLLNDIKEGLVVEELMGATQGNLLGGDFSGNVLLGYKVENGKITGRVKNTMVSGNVYALLKEGITVGSDSRWLGGSMKTPSILCPAVAVSATG